MAKGGAMSQSSTLVNRGGGGSANSGALSSRAPPTAAGLRKRSSKGSWSPAESRGPDYSRRLGSQNLVILLFRARTECICLVMCQKWSEGLERISKWEVCGLAARTAGSSRSSGYGGLNFYTDDSPGFKMSPVGVLGE